MKSRNCLLSGLLFIALSGCAGEGLSNSPKEIRALSSLDCTVDNEQCRYIAAVEVAAYFDACPIAISRKYNVPGPTASEVTDIDALLASWKELDNPELKAAVLDKNNPLRLYLKHHTLDYLVSVPVGDIGIECSRLGMVREGQSAVSMSDLLRHTKDDGKGHKSVFQ